MTTIAHKGARVVYAGDRDVSVSVLEFLLEPEVEPVALMVPATGSRRQAPRTRPVPRR